MKKVLLTLALIATVALSASAQLTGGAKAGLNFANISGDEDSENKMRTSIHLGGYLNFALSDALSIQPELLYNSVGTKNEEGDFKSVIKLNYLSVPVMFQYGFADNKFNIQAGPQFSFLLSAKNKVEFDGDSETEDIKDSLKGLDLGLNLGAGANFDKLNITLRYSIGLSNTYDGPGDFTAKNNVLQLSVGYRLFGE